jgi:hypothetical protein
LGANLKKFYALAVVLAGLIVAVSAMLAGSMLVTLASIVILLASMIPFIGLVQGTGRRRQVDLLRTLESLPVARSTYYKIAMNYLANVDTATVGRRYTMQVAVLFGIIVFCGSVTYFGAQWGEYLQVPNQALGGTFVAHQHSPTEIAAYQSITVATASAAFIGAYVYIIRSLLRRANNNDIFPISYYYFSGRIIVACLVAAIFRHSIFLLDYFHIDDESQLLIAVGFVIGLKPDLWIAAFVTLLLKRFKILGLQKNPDKKNLPSSLSLILLEGLTDQRMDRLEELDLDSCQALADHNPFLIWTRTPYQFPHIVDWMAQAQLIVLVKDEGIQKLRAVGIRDIFGFEVAINGSSQLQIAKTLEIPEHMTADIAVYLQSRPSFQRLKEVYDLLCVPSPAKEFPGAVQKLPLPASLSNYQDTLSPRDQTQA